MSEPLSAFDTAGLAPESLAVLLDFDGTLVGIADRPDAVVLKAHTVETLSRLEEVLDGAVAIVSGRSIADIDRMLGPHRFAVAGIHGLERRGRDGRTHTEAYDRAALDRIAEELGAIADAEPGLGLERKAGSVALHYRQRPELDSRCREAAAAAVERQPGARILTGKMVVEVKLGARTKADAVSDFMAEPPFAGRTPLYAGDDVTDEDAFRAVAALDGVSIRIGSGETAAGYWAEDTEAFLDWLDRLSARLAERQAARLGERP
jgi:trehalose 6-phosphate phosphatase